MPGPNRNMKMAKPKNAKKSLKRIFSYMSDNKLLLVIVFIGIVISSLVQLVGIIILQKIIDEAILPMAKSGITNTLMWKFVQMLIITGVAYGVGALCSYGYSRIMLVISTKALFKIRTQLFDSMERLPIRYFDKHTHGELMSRYTNDTDTIREMLSNSFTNVISSGLMVVTSFALMLVYSWQLTLLVIAILILMIEVVKFLGSRSGKYFKEQQKELGHVNGYIEELIDGQKEVKVFCHEQPTKEEFHEINEQLRQASTRANTYAIIMMPIMGNISNILFALTTVLGSILAINGILTTGIVIAFLQLTKSFSQPVMQISQQSNTILTALAGAERIFEVIDEQPETDDGYVTLVNAKVDDNGNITETDDYTGHWAWKHPHQADNTVTYTPLEGKVEFDNVVFGYEENKTVLNGISLTAHPGQTVAFVGSTGAGKTTITNLINRFYDVPDGKIRYDGININKIKKDDLRRSLSMVLQDTHLFSGTVMDNIRYGNLKANDDDCIAAAKLANADFFIRHLPNGYQTVITSDGTNLSQGQRQLLAIARAAVANPPVLILDEATSSIDTRTESLIEKGMHRLMQGRTVFVIAHRLSTVRNADAIMVLEQGNIIERGNHDELIAEKGKYYQLYTGMFELS